MLLLLRGLLRASAAAAACARPRAPDGPLPRPAPPTSVQQVWPAGPLAHVCLAVGPVMQGGWDHVFADMGASVPVATGFVTLCGAAAYAYSLIAKRDVGVKALDEKLAALEGKLSKEMGGLASTMNEKVNGLASTMNEKVDGLEGKLGKEMGGLASTMNEKVNGLEGKLGKEMGGLASTLGKEMGGLASTMNEKVNGLEGKLGKEMSGMVMNARSEAKAAALEVMKDYKVSAVSGTARKA